MNYFSALSQSAAYMEYQKRAVIGMNQNALQSGKISVSQALDEFANVNAQASSSLNGGLQYAARDLCFKKGTLNEYEFCDELLPTTPGPYSLDCLQKAFLKAGGQKTGTMYPNSNTLNFWNSQSTWADVNNAIQTLYNNTKSSTRSTQEEGMKRFYGIKLENKTEPLYPNSFSYQGCYRDQGNRALPNFLGNVGSVNDCKTKAMAGRYNTFGLQYYGECWAGNNTDWNKYGQINPDNSCGNLGTAWNNKVYTNTNPLYPFDNYKVYRAGDKITYNGSTYSFNAYIGAAGYGPGNYPQVWTKE
jgi:hypothetical protein